MKEILRTRSFAVYDDLLPAADYERVWDFIQLESYKPVHQKRWEKVWTLTDGTPLAGTGIFTRKTAGQAAEEDARYYPTRTGIDKLIEKILATAESFSHLIGKHDVDWTFVTAKAFRYPAGTGLSWHIDSKTPTGAYVFYAHPVWKSGWGGELFIADESCFGQDLQSYKTTTTAQVEGGKVIGFRTEEVPSPFDDRRRNEILSEIALGQYIQPKPNRLVVMRNGIPHCIRKVEPAAGENVRCSIAGFFQP